MPRKRKPLLGLPDREALEELTRRYYGKFERLDFTDTKVRNDLALHLGFLLGLAWRLLEEKDRRAASAARLALPLERLGES